VLTWKIMLLAFIICIKRPFLWKKLVCQYEIVTQCRDIICIWCGNFSEGKLLHAKRKYIKFLKHVKKKWKVVSTICSLYEKNTHFEKLMYVHTYLNISLLRPLNHISLSVCFVLLMSVILFRYFKIFRNDRETWLKRS